MAPAGAGSAVLGIFVPFMVSGAGRLEVFATTIGPELPEDCPQRIPTFAGCSGTLANLTFRSLGFMLSC